MHQESTVGPDNQEGPKRGRPTGSKDRTARVPSQPLPESITCEVCGVTVRPKTRGRRFCSQTCYHVWWKDAVKDRAARAGAAATRQAIEAGIGPGRDELGRYHASGPEKQRPSTEAVPAVSTLEVVRKQEPDEEMIWAERGDYWGTIENAPAPRPTAFGPLRPDRKPLVLNGHGITLRIHQGALVIRNGFTHYPQTNPELRFFPGDRKLPARIILLDSDGSISFDVIAWLSQQRVPLIVLNYQGEVVSVIGEGWAYDPELRIKQLAALTNGAGLQLSIELIRQKIEGCRETLQTFWKSPLGGTGLMKLQVALEELTAGPESVEAVRLIEARAALAYFTCWREQPITWKGTGRKPIPEEWHRCGTRQGVLGTTNRHAAHPVNAMLNYSYAALESHVRIAALTEGLDPTIGYMHAMHPSRLALVYDLMEPCRALVDRQVLEFVQHQTFMPEDFLMTERGVCRLHPELARRVIRLAANTGIEDVIRQAAADLRTTRVNCTTVA